MKVVWNCKIFKLLMLLQVCQSNFVMVTCILFHSHVVWIAALLDMTLPPHLCCQACYFWISLCLSMSLLDSNNRGPCKKTGRGVIGKQRWWRRRYFPWWTKTVHGFLFLFITINYGLCLTFSFRLSSAITVNQSDMFLNSACERPFLFFIYLKAS